MSEVASAYVSLLPSARGFGSKLNGAIGGDVDKAGKSSGERFGHVFLKSGLGPLRAFGEVAAGLFAVDKIKDFFGSAIDEARDSQKVSALTTQVIKSTGGAANVSAKQIGNLSTALSNKIGVDDEAIQSGANMLLTFKGIRNEAGAGNKIFNQTTRVMTDVAASMAAASGGQLDYKSTAIQLGKALNDPVKGMTALTRVGVTFTDQQSAQIKALVASGKTMDAQKVILKELSSEFGGSAKAQATAGQKMSVAWGNLEETIGTALLPVLDKAEGAITKKVIPAVSKFVTQMQDGTGAGGEFVADLKQIGDTAKGIAKFLDALPGPVKSFGAETAIAALVIPRMLTGLNAMGGAFSLTSAKIKQTYAEMTYAETRTQRLSAVTGNLGGALRQAAGIGGMVLLINSTQQSSKAMSTLERAAGGAALGFSVGGPFGAALGSGIGLISGLASETDHGANAFRDYQAKVKQIDMAQATANIADFAGTVDAATLALTKNTRAMVVNKLQGLDANKNGMGDLLEYAAKYNVSQKTIVDGLLGQKAALSQMGPLWRGLGTDINNAWVKAPDQNDHTSELAKQRDMLIELRKQWGTLPGQIQRGVDKTKEAALANQGFVGTTQRLKTLLSQPLVARISAKGLSGTRSEVADLSKKYKLVPKDIKTLLKLEGFSGAPKQVAAVESAVKGLSKAKPNPQIAEGVRGAVNKAKGTADAGSRDLKRLLLGPLNAAKPKMDSFIPGISGAIRTAKPVASTGGRSVGIAMSGGFAATVGGGSAPANFASLVSRTYAAGMAAADAHSPSRKTKKLGQWMGDGLVLGLAARKGAAKGAGDKLVHAALKGASSAAKKSKLNKQFTSIVDLIGDGISGKGKKGKANVQKVKDSLGKLTDSIKTQLDRQLQTAKDKVTKIADTISSLKDTIAQTASSVAQNYLPDFTTNALFGPDGSMIKGTAVSSFKSQLSSQKTMLDQVTTAYAKLKGEGLNGNWLSSLLQSGNNNLILDLANSSKSSALSAQSMYQQVQSEANALGSAVANNTTSKAQLDAATKQLAVAQRGEAAAQRREVALKSIDHKLDKLDKLKKLDTLDTDITRGLNRLIAAANNGRRS